MNWTYKFGFIEAFESLNGIYKVVQIMSYKELLDSNLSLYDGLYVHVNKTQQDLDNDVAKYRTDDILKLESVIDKTKVYYIPSKILRFIPETNVNKYAKLAVGLNVGPCNSKEDLDHIVEALQQLMTKMFGISQSPSVFSVGSVWLTDAEYATITAERDNEAREVINYYGENKKLLETISQQNETIRQLQLLIKDHLG